MNMPQFADLRSISLTLALPVLARAAVSFACNDVRVGGNSYDFDKLKGPHTVHSVRRINPSIRNTTFTLDICAPLKLDKARPSEDQCPFGTRVCGTTQVYREKDGWNPDIEEEEVITIAGDFTVGSSRPLSPTWSSLNSSDSHEDSKKDGLRLELNGGLHPLPPDDTSKPQKAIIEFICDEDKTGLEGEVDSQQAMMLSSEQRRTVENRKIERDDDGDEPEPLPDPDKGKSLAFFSFDTETIGSGSNKKEGRVLRLTWRTKYACVGQADKPDDTDSKTSAGWGFFTWFIIILFLAVAAYLIFGSWLNYNRHGARGWDLLPHGDTMRDVPYILKEWTRRVIGTLQGGRGGYSAV